MKIALSAESTLDLSKELLEKYDVNVLPFTVLLGENEYKDGEITGPDIFDYVEKNKILPRTCAVNEYQYRDYFRSFLENGYDAVIHISLSSGISSSHDNALKASQKFDNVYVIDSASLSTGIALEVIYARKLINKGLDVKEIVEKVKARIPYVQASFVIQTDRKSVV